MESNQKKVAMPPMPPKAELYLPLAFWSEIIVHLDTKLKVLVEDYGYGKVEIAVTVNRGKIQDVVFNNELRVRGLLDKAGPVANVHGEQAASGVSQEKVNPT